MRLVEMILQDVIFISQTSWREVESWSLRFYEADLQPVKMYSIFTKYRQNVPFYDAVSDIVKNTIDNNSSGVTFK